MKKILIFAFAICVTQAKFLWLDPANMVSEYIEVLSLIEKLETSNRGRQGRPVVKSIAYDILNNLVNLLTDPSWVNLVAVMADYGSYFIMPLNGGYASPFAHSKYLEDEKAYEDAGVTEDFLFKEATNMFKEKYWQFFGLLTRTTES
jgi:hypothetical protein